jgi:hypothetical protein
VLSRALSGIVIRLASLMRGGSIITLVYELCCKASQMPGKKTDRKLAPPEKVSAVGDLHCRPGTM